MNTQQCPGCNQEIPVEKGEDGIRRLSYHNRVDGRYCSWLGTVIPADRNKTRYFELSAKTWEGQCQS